MSNKITSAVIGELIQDEEIEDWWTSKQVSIPFFDGKKLTVTFQNFEPGEDDTFIHEADEALKHFIKLNTEDRVAISELVYDQCKETLDTIDSDEEDLTLPDKKNDIWKMVHPDEILVTRRPYREPDMYVQVMCECDWDEEHGLQLVFRQGKKITRVSAQDGHLTEADAYSKPDEEDELLSKF